jgi:hypothetical protein
MRIIRLTAVGIGLILLMAPAFSQDPRLSYNLAVGENYYLDIDIQQNTSSESLNSEDINMYSLMKVEFRIDSTDPYGIIHMSVRYKELLLSMLAPGMGLDINSSTGNNRVLADLVDTLQMESFRVSMFESGELRSLEGLDRIFGDMAAYPARDTNELEVILKTLDEAYGVNAFKGIFNLFVAYYPTVQPIKNWTRDLTYYFNSKPVVMVNRYFLTKTTDDLVTIQGMGMLNSMKDFTETISMGQVKSSVSGSQTFDYQVDRETGWMKKCVSRQRVLITTTIVESKHFPMGLEIPSFTETVFDVKGHME